MPHLAAAKGAMKGLLRRNPVAYEVVRRRRGRRQEADYLARRDGYASSAGPVFADPGYLVRSGQLLRSRWQGPRAIKEETGAVRVFAIAADDSGGPQLLETISAAFDAVLFDLAPYRSLDALRHDRSLEWRPRLQRDVVAAFEAADAESPVDLTFAYASHMELEASTLEALRATGAPVVVLCLDDKHRFAEDRRLHYPNGQQPLIGSVDVHLTNSRECVRWYLGEGAPAYYMPQGINTDLYPSLDVDRDIEVSFMGQRYGARVKFLEALEKAGIRVSCFGPGWDTRVVSHEEKIQIYNRSVVNLGIGAVAYSDRITCVKGRDFEVPATGGTYLTTYDPELAGLFDIGREILCYRNEVDCAEVIRYYLERPDDAREIGRAGRERCIRDHTWAARFEELLRWMGIVARPGDDGPRPQPAA